MNLLPLEMALSPQRRQEISCKHCDQVSFVIWAEPAMNGLTTEKFQRFPIADIES